jgi:beta-1,4-mannosyl-glycoprotein beta-1,4-N-acetylglucosaminyltransferase
VLDPFVDVFVINECTKTFSGNNKPLFFQENKKLFKKFEHKIIYHTFDVDKPEWNQWDRDAIHKNAAMEALQNCENSDIIFYSDADEIWEPKAINFDNFNNDTLYICYQDIYYYYLNTLFGDPNSWKGTKYSSWGLLKQHSIDTFRNWDSYFHKDNNYKKKYIDKAGYHFSFLGGAENVKYKIQSYGHQEFNCPPYLDNIQNNINNLRDPFFRNNFQIKPVPISYETHPKYLVDNLDKYDNLIWKG